MRRCGQILGMNVPYRWTRDAYHQLWERGVLTEGTRVELIEGELLQMSPWTRQHLNGIMYPTTVLVRLFGDTHVVRVQCGYAIGDDSEPLPDFAICPLADVNHADLLIEVSHTSLAHDRKRKAPLYARAGVPEYWIVNIPRRVVEVRRQPEDGKYRQLRIYRVEEMVQPLFAPAVEVPLESFFLES